MKIGKLYMMNKNSKKPRKATAKQKSKELDSVNNPPTSVKLILTMKKKKREDRFHKARASVSLSPQMKEAKDLSFLSLLLFIIRNI